MAEQGMIKFNGASPEKSERYNSNQLSVITKQTPVSAEQDEVCYTADRGNPEFRKAECLDCFVILPRNDRRVDESQFDPPLYARVR